MKRCNNSNADEENKHILTYYLNTYEKIDSRDFQLEAKLHEENYGIGECVNITHTGKGNLSLLKIISPIGTKIHKYFVIKI